MRYSRNRELRRGLAPAGGHGLADPSYGYGVWGTVYDQSTHQVPLREIKYKTLVKTLKTVKQ